MDLALIYNPQLQEFDLAIDGADLAGEEGLASVALVSLLCDRLVEPYEVNPGQDRRGWWADAFSANNHLTGSRLWLLEREKQLPGVLQRCKQYCQEALQWFIDDEIAKAITVTVFNPRMGWLVALIKFEINDGTRTFRFEFEEATQVWKLAGEAF